MADDPADVLRGYLACGDAGTLDDLATWLHDDVVVQRVAGTHDGAFLGIDPTGRPVTVDQALFVRVIDGRIAELWEVTDTGQALRQLGRVPDDQPLSPGPYAPAPPDA
jgi:ketosteroid isomerase-like protein